MKNYILAIIIIFGFAFIYGVDKGTSDYTYLSLKAKNITLRYMDRNLKIEDKKQKNLILKSITNRNFSKSKMPDNHELFISVEFELENDFKYINILRNEYTYIAQFEGKYAHLSSTEKSEIENLISNIFY